MENAICLSLCVSQAKYAIGLLVDLLGQIQDRFNPFLNPFQISCGMYGTFSGFNPSWNNAFISVDMRCADVRASYKMITKLISYIQETYGPGDSVCHVYYLK